jgi:DNA-binding NtrC family response regulator
VPCEQGRAVLARRLLIVEDEPRLRDMLSRATRDMEFEISTAGSAEAALALLEKTDYDIILTDLNLPGQQGMDLCELVRRRWPDTQLIILTGYGALGVAQAAMRLDVVDFLTKPCSLGDLEAALNRALRRRRDLLAPALAADLAHDDDIDPSQQTDQPRTLDEVEREHVLAALARHDGNRVKAATELGISVRTLYYRLRDYERQGHIVGERGSD